VLRYHHDQSCRISDSFDLCTRELFRSERRGQDFVAIDMLHKIGGSVPAGGSVLTSPSPSPSLSSASAAAAAAAADASSGAGVRGEDAIELPKRVERGGAAVVLSPDEGMGGQVSGVSDIDEMQYHQRRQQLAEPFSPS
jgi:hypothetical protein